VCVSSIGERERERERETERESERERVRERDRERESFSLVSFLFVTFMAACRYVEIDTCMHHVDM
jgi:hypothetical protein